MSNCNNPPAIFSVMFLSCSIAYWYNMMLLFLDLAMGKLGRDSELRVVMHISDSDLIRDSVTTAVSGFAERQIEISTVESEFTHKQD